MGHRLGRPAGGGPRRHALKGPSPAGRHRAGRIRPRVHDRPRGGRPEMRGRKVRRLPATGVGGRAPPPLTIPRPHPAFQGFTHPRQDTPRLTLVPSRPKMKVPNLAAPGGRSMKSKPAAACLLTTLLLPALPAAAEKPAPRP